MAVRYYNDLHEIEDVYRKAKYHNLIMSSLNNDLSKWTEELSTSKTIYNSPWYNESRFSVEIRFTTIFVYVTHKTPIIKDRNSELISDNFPKDLEAAVKNLRENIFTPEIYELEKLVGTQNGRKEKLESIELEKIKEFIEDTYQDWITNDSEICAKLIAKIIYSYRRKEEISKLWLDKFKDISFIINEIEKLKN